VRLGAYVCVMTKRPYGLPLRAAAAFRGVRARTGRYVVVRSHPGTTVRGSVAGARARRRAAGENAEETAAFLAVPGNHERVAAGVAAARAGDVVPASVVLDALAARRERGPVCAD
jgi:hypothetical protein